MADELKSLMGRQLGMTPSDFLTGADDSIAGSNFKGLQIGGRGKTFWFGSPRYIVDQDDDFLGAVLNTNAWDVNKGSDGAAVNFALLLPSANGTVRGTSGANASADMAGNGVQICGGLNFLVSNGGMIGEAWIKPAAITTGNFFVGLHDTTAHTLQAPFTISAGVVTANATNAVGFVFDTSATAATTKLCSVNAGGTAQIVDTGLTPDTVAFHRYHVALDSSGNGYFFIDGLQVGALIATKSYNITDAVATTAVVGLKVSYFRRAATATNFDIDQMTAQQSLSTAR